jgi:uncharacterized cupin superfamily protein
MGMSGAAVGDGADEPLVLNLADARARRHPRRASIIELEPAGARWADTGVNVRVMQPGQPSGLYHAEEVQEDFLVLYGRCLGILGEQEVQLRQWDFVHCPGRVPHVFVGAGEAPSAVLMIGARRGGTISYPVSELAGRYGASVTHATQDPAVAYAAWRALGWEPAPGTWEPG